MRVVPRVSVPAPAARRTRVPLPVLFSAGHHRSRACFTKVSWGSEDDLRTGVGGTSERRSCRCPGRITAPCAPASLTKQSGHVCVGDLKKKVRAHAAPARRAPAGVHALIITCALGAGGSVHTSTLPASPRATQESSHAIPCMFRTVHNHRSLVRPARGVLFRSEGWHRGHEGKRRRPPRLRVRS